MKNRYYKQMVSVLLFFILCPLVNWAQQLSLYETVSIKTGTGLNDIGNQLGGKKEQPYSDPFKGFAVTSRGEILIQDVVNMRVQRFSRHGTILKPLIMPDLFWPGEICVSENDEIFVSDDRIERVITFSSDGTVVRTFNPGYRYFKLLYRSVPILSLKCYKNKLTLVYGIDRVLDNKIMPIYEDIYDLNFSLLHRKEYSDDRAYYSSLLDKMPNMILAFVDNRGYHYYYTISQGHTGRENRLGINRDQALLKYSPSGDLVFKIDSEWLSRNMKYHVGAVPGSELTELKGNNLSIFNWYVTHNGNLYILLANNDLVKVFRIIEGDDRK
ncbi:MAG: hypothetical protein A4E64_02954 [Syntrophorhabdus sp. PtaU1.Bin058]|nr:MAG: hypothetical protein A4E64_02954 [Syntrophorhabdus sp. PtaU1.Bin058]